MEKRLREILKSARSLGVEKPRFEPGGEHIRLIGTVSGRSFEMPISFTKAWSTQRNKLCTRLNIRRAVERLRGEAA